MSISSQQANSNFFNRSIQWLCHTFASFQGLAKNTEKNSEIIDVNTQYEQTKKFALERIRAKNSRQIIKQRFEKMSKFVSHKIHQYEKPLELMCPICMDFYNYPVSTKCAHTFCLQCLDQAVLFNPNCPVCRTEIRGCDMIICKAISQVVMRYLEKYTNDIYHDNYMNRRHQTQKWLNQRSIDILNISPSDLLDVRDTEFIWCKAIVNEVYLNENGQQHSILIHYLGWSNIYDEIIELKSQRFASYKFYTSRQDIPHYHLYSENDNNMYSFVIIGTFLPFQMQLLTHEINTQQEQNHLIGVDQASQFNANEEQNNNQQQINNENIQQINEINKNIFKQLSLKQQSLLQQLQIKKQEQQEQLLYQESQKIPNIFKQNQINIKIKNININKKQISLNFKQNNIEQQQQQSQQINKQQTIQYINNKNDNYNYLISKNYDEFIDLKTIFHTSNS